MIATLAKFILATLYASSMCWHTATWASTQVPPPLCQPGDGGSCSGATHSLTAIAAHAVRAHLVYDGPLSAEKNQLAIFRIEMLDDGTVTKITLKRSSTVPEYDEAVQTAILKASPLPIRPGGGKASEVEVAFLLRGK